MLVKHNTEQSPKPYINAGVILLNTAIKSYGNQKFRI